MSERERQKFTERLRARERERERERERVRYTDIEDCQVAPKFTLFSQIFFKMNGAHFLVIY